LKAVVLAAGEGTRLRPFTNSRPKVMIPVANRPILQHVLEGLVKAGIKDIVLVVGYKKERIMSHFGDGKAIGANIQYVVQDRQLGTAHALHVAKGAVNDDFLVVAGDNLIDLQTVQDLLKHNNGNAVVVTSSEIPSKYGVVRTEGDLVVSIVEKPSNKISNIISTGMYRFTPNIFKLIDEGIAQGESTITDILQRNLQKVPLHVVRTSGRWMDAVYPWDLIRLNGAAMDFQGQQLVGTVEKGAVIKGDVTIGTGSKIRSGCYIEGPVMIGEGCDIGPQVTIMPSTSIGNGVSIGPYTYIEESLIGDSVSLSSHSHLSHCVLDEGVTSGPGLQCPAEAAVSRVDLEYFNIKKIGALVGESSTIGAGVVIEPGCIVGAGCKIASNSRVSGTLENRSIVV
jgi:UDP-N-acetylglucosamine diphosphorylase / glucose-1-phosphate thymidylyltransferase / UDP-N-acetylgalactosamine diphosphorylase / glucosamine-1-phosphate N-acetyltransferase / galactosamine-1-phosphate N-acetyltransferase